MVTWVFFAAAALAVVFAIVTVVHRSPVINVLSLAMMFFGMAAIFAILGMDFLAAIQLIVYSGAVLVLFLFVVMLLNIRKADRFGSGARPIQVALGAVAAVAVGALVILALSGLAPDTGAALPGVVDQGTVYAIGEALLGSHLFAFEFISLLLVAAMVGAVYLARKEDAR